MSDDPFTDWRSYGLRFADPAYAPDWLPELPPPWPGSTPNIAFREWVGARLEELEDRIFAEHPASRGRRLSPAEWVSAVVAAMPPDALKGFLRDYGRARFAATKGASKPSVEQTLRTLIRMDDPGGKRRGPTALPELRALEPAGLAGWDIWMMRKIIIPRFWPDAAAGEYHLDKWELARIAAQRRKCTKEQALRFYRDDRLGGH